MLPFRVLRAETFRSAFVALIATAGIRLDSINPARIAALILIMAGFAFHHFVAEHWSNRMILYYFTALFLLRYLFLFTGFGKKGFAGPMIAKYGESNAWDRYETITSCLFFQRGLCFGLLISASKSTIAPWDLISSGWCLGVGFAFAITGLWINVTSCQVIGIDTYFYKDLFLGRSLIPYKAEGPYKLFRNPMYGVGQLGAYGAALMAGSFMGLLATAINQIVMYIFYYCIERPHIRSSFGK